MPRSATISAFCLCRWLEWAIFMLFSLILTKAAATCCNCASIPFMPVSNCSEPLLTPLSNGRAHLGKAGCL